MAGEGAKARPTSSSASASSDALIVFLWLPLADPSLDLRFAVILITSVCVFPRHKKTGSNKGRPVRVHTDIHFGSRCNHVRSRSRLCRLNLSVKQPLSVVWQIRLGLRYFDQLSSKKYVLDSRDQIGWLSPPSRYNVSGRDFVTGMCRLKGGNTHDKAHAGERVPKQCVTTRK